MILFGICHILAPYFFAPNLYFTQSSIIFDQKSKKLRFFLLIKKTFITFAVAFKPRWRNR